ncbi:GPI-GlcNAc transferase complex, PIG-H component [Melia azedarach]|uniref:GPI-GlcNAc transferase complex, PIG-H component n=1 Tax=Melia azedarach TaxID=155640 RepID=A0ACC1XUS1_MELAZ|nr:GPI-GlcNAc transferase complex, PIG-H component [Melia azedarach]
MVDENSIVSRRYTYVRECNCPVEAIDIHHVLVKRSKAKRFFIYLSVFVGLSNSLFLVLSKNESIIILFWSFILSAFLVKLLLWKPVEKESVIIMPALGVQLETHYSSGRTVRRFFPIGKILRPVLLECVTPITCYWSLSLVVRDEEELMLVFKELHPPVKMLVPIWKALCATNDCKGDPDTDDG